MISEHLVLLIIDRLLASVSILFAARILCGHLVRGLLLVAAGAEAHLRESQIREASRSPWCQGSTANDLRRDILELSN